MAPQEATREIARRMADMGAPDQVRDLTLWRQGDRVYVVACDSNAAILGERPADRLRKAPRTVGYSVAKVPLMEVCAAGAAPLLVVNTLCGALDDYGQQILDGIRDAVGETGCDAWVTGSDETNMVTAQTGVGVTVVACGRAGDITLGGSRPDDAVFCIGVPRDGLLRPYEEGEPGIASVRHLLAVARSGLGRELLPVGSRGVRHELGQLAATASLRYRLEPACEVELDCSAGASTCFLASAPASAAGALGRVADLPVTRVATLVTDDTGAPDVPVQPGSQR